MARKGKGHRGRLPGKAGGRRISPQQLKALSVSAGEALQNQDYAQALTQLLELAQAVPPNYSIFFNAGYSAMQCGDFDLARQQFKKALEVDPGTVDAQLNYADCLNMLGQVEEADGLYREVIARHPGNLRAIRARILILDARNDVTAAESLLQQVVQQDPQADDFNLLGNVQFKQGRLEDAATSYSACLDLQPTRLDAANNLGLVWATRGERERALQQFRVILKQNPGFTESWRNLATLRRFDYADDPEIVSMRELKNQGVSGDAAVHLGLALGKALDDCGEYSEAFDNFYLANTERRKHIRFDVGELREHADRIITQFSPEYVAKKGNSGVDRRLPIFIVGMPRSGTTLLEQIVSSHPQVHGGGELLVINELIQNLEQRIGGSYPECVVNLTQSELQVLSLDCLDRISKLAPEAARITDKMPYNFFHLGLINQLFPRAVVLQCERHPLDVCLSAWFNYFPSGLDFTWSLEDVAAVYALYRRMMKHWHQALDITILEVQYEDLVSEPEAQLTRVMESMGLEYDSELLNFHESSRPVQTLSAWQVRRPLYRESRARWMNYRDQIGPLVDALHTQGVDISTPAR